MVDIVPEQDRLRAFSLNYWAINLGFAFAAMMAGVLAGVDFRLLFVINAATTVIGGDRRRGRGEGAAAPGHGRAVRRQRRPPAQPGLGAVFRDRVFMGFVAVNVLLAHRVHAAHLDAADGDGPRRPAAGDVRHA